MRLLLNRYTRECTPLGAGEMLPPTTFHLETKPFFIGSLTFFTEKQQIFKRFKAETSSQ